MRILQVLSALLTCGALALPALADPGVIPVQGVLTTLDGLPVDGDTDLHFALYESEGAATPLWSETQLVDLDSGFFTAYLGVTNVLEMTLFADTPSAWLGVSVGTNDELPRVAMGEAGRAGYAQLCGESETFGGLTPDAYAFAAGDGLALSGGTMSLSAEGCSPGDVLKRSPSGSGWVCGPDQLGTGGGLGSLGAGLVLVGDSLSVDKATIEGWARGVCYDTTSELTAALDGVYAPADHATPWTKLTGIPAGFADGVDNDTTYVPGEGLVLSGSTFGMKPAQLGALGGVAAGSCAVGNVVVGIGVDGKIDCAPAGQASSGGLYRPPLSDAGLTKISVGVGAIGTLLRGAGDYLYAYTPYQIVRMPWAGGLPEPLATGFLGVRGLAIDDTHIYYADYENSGPGNGSNVGRVPIAGGALEPLATGLSSAKRPQSIYLIGNNIYWGSDAGLYVMSKTGTIPTLLDSGLTSYLCHDTTYFWYMRSQALMRYPIVGGVAETMLTVGTPTAMACTDDHVVVATATALLRISKTNGRPMFLATPAASVFGTMLVDSGWLYYLTQGNHLYVTAIDGSTIPDLITLTGAYGLLVRNGTLYIAINGISTYPALQ